MAATRAKGLAMSQTPIYLKRVLLQHRLSQSALSRALQVPSSTLCAICNWDQWPGNHDPQAIKRGTEEYLAAQGVPPSTVKRIWEEDAEGDTAVSPFAVVARSRRLSPALSTRNTIVLHDELPEKAMLSQKAKQHFALWKDPFIEDINGPEDVYRAADQQYVTTAMYQTCKRGGFIAVIAESGAGKTTLRRDLLDRIAREDPNIRVVFPRIFDKTRITASSICDAILADFGQRPQNALEAKARQIEKLLAESARGGNSHCIMIEEAHDIPIPVLKYMKRFWELEDGFKKLISVILIGQPELRNTLNEYLHPEIREVSRRCEQIELQPLGKNLEEYLKLKFSRVQKRLEDIFEKDAFDAIRGRLTVHRGQSRAPVNMMYPLVVNNCVTAAMNQCVELGLERINADLIKEL